MCGGPDVPSGPPRPRDVNTGDPGVTVPEDATQGLQILPTGYTSWDKGRTWREDPNTHIRDKYGNQWYVPAGADPYDPSNWHRDTMAGYHMSAQEYQQMQEAKRQQEEMERMQREALELQRRYVEEQARAQQEYLAMVKRYQEEMEAKARAEEEALRAREKRRLQLMRLGRRRTILTGPRGADMTTLITRKRKLGGSTRTGASARTY